MAEARTPERLKTSAMRQVYEAYQSDPFLEHLKMLGTNPFVPYSGDIMHPRISIVGEAPGKAEARRRMPFCGPSGKVLNEMLAAIDISRHEVFVTNLVKYRPPQNRDPTHAEIASSLTYLKDELAIAGCRTVFLLGRHAMAAILGPGAPISACHGRVVPRWDPYGRWRFVPMFHPAVALYNPSMRRTMLHDYKNVGRMMRL